MKKQPKTINQQNAGKQAAKKTQRAKRAGQMLSAVMAGAAVFTPLAVATGCKMETEYVDVPVPTYPEITIPVRLFDKTMNVVCPGNLIGESYTKLNGAMPQTEEHLNSNLTNKNKITIFLSNNDVSIIVKTDGSVATCERISGSFSIAVSYQWLLANSTINDNIETAIMSILLAMESEIAKGSARVPR
jgi:tRNA U54 and U55 pseudouridine synthase Pus10